MIIEDGSVKIKGEDFFYHIKVVSQSDKSKHYYVTADSRNGLLLGCTCPAAATFPYKQCKHQKAIIDQRLLQKG